MLGVARVWWSVAGVMLLAGGAMAQVRVGGLRCEYAKGSLGVDAARPRLFWQLQSEERGVVQGAYRVLVARSEALLEAGKGDLRMPAMVAGSRVTEAA